MIELPNVPTFANNFSAVDSIQIDTDGAWQTTTGVSLVIYADASVVPEFAIPYNFIRGSDLGPLQDALARNVTLRTMFAHATVSLAYENNEISLNYTSPGAAYRPENALLSIPETNNNYWVAVYWEGNKMGNCDPDLTFAGTKLIFDDKELLEMNGTGTIVYPEAYKKCDIVAFRSLNTCSATINQDGKKVKITQTSPAVQSSPLLLVLPLSAPLNGTNATISCELDKQLDRNCTILLTIPPYDCGCGGQVSSYEFNTTCSPIHVQNEVYDGEFDENNNNPEDNGKLTLNCTASNFTEGVRYRAMCKWPGNANAPQGKYHSDWSIPHALEVRVANLTRGKLVPRAPFPLAVIIVSAIFLGIGLVVVVWVMIKRRSEFKYQTIQ